MLSGGYTKQVASYKKLIVWQRAKTLALRIYTHTESFPRHELFGLASQMRRAAVSIPSNIAEGSYRGGEKEFKQFLRIAYGSGAELETQLEIARGLSFLDEVQYEECQELLTEVMKILNALVISPKH